MHDEHGVVVEIGEEIFCAPAERDDAAPGETLPKARRETESANPGASDRR